MSCVSNFVNMGKFGRVLVFFLGVFVALTAGQQKENDPEFLKYLRKDDELSTFASHLERYPMIPTMLRYREGTIFAPTKSAFKNYVGSEIDDNILFYHSANLAQTTDKFGDTISSDLPGNLILWITRKGSDIYVNDARIMRGNKTFQTENKKDQILHVIDRVLEPPISSSPDTSLYNPDAQKFLQNSAAFSRVMGEYKISKFAQQVEHHRKMDIFATAGKHTFFIPVDQPYEKRTGHQNYSLNTKNIDAHVIPDYILFSRSLEERKEYKTLAFGDNVKVSVSMSNSGPKDSYAQQTYVSSNTMTDDLSLGKGAVQAKVVKGNIPVKNGVVHLIAKPLTIMDQSVYELLQEEQSGQLSEFYKLLRNHASTLLDNIQKDKEMTLFIPSNDAFQKVDRRRFDQLISDHAKVLEIVQLHMVQQRVASDGDLWTNRHQVREVPTMAPRRKLYFNIIGTNSNRILTVEGGGVNATVIQPDIGATNGVIHIIDRILGVPSQTVYEKLQTNPLLNKTFHLGQQGDFNEKFKQKEKQYTYFVPSDAAWDKVYRNWSSTYKKLFMKEFSYQATQILEQHLIVNEMLTVEQLARASEQYGLIQLVRGRVNVTEDKSNPGAFTIERDGVRANITRPNVECTNGIVHIIDTVLMKDRDVTVNSGYAASAMFFLTTISTLLVALFLV